MKNMKLFAPLLVAVLLAGLVQPVHAQTTVNTVNRVDDPVPALLIAGGRYGSLYGESILSVDRTGLTIPGRVAHTRFVYRIEMYNFTSTDRTGSADATGEVRLRKEYGENPGIWVQLLRGSGTAMDVTSGNSAAIDLRSGIWEVNREPVRTYAIAVPLLLRGDDNLFVESRTTNNVFAFRALYVDIPQ